MATHRNGTSPATDAPTLPDCQAPALARAELDAYDDAIAMLDAALADAAGARRDLLAAQTEMEYLDAAVVARIEGGNEQQRKARHTLALAELTGYQCAASEARNARERLADAERRIVVGKERCRLLRASLAIVAGAG